MKSKIAAYDAKRAGAGLTGSDELSPNDPERVALLSALRNYLL